MQSNGTFFLYSTAGALLGSSFGYSFSEGSGYTAVTDLALDPLNQRVYFSGDLSGAGVRGYAALDFSFAAIPEPGTATALASLLALGCAALRRRPRRR